VRCASLRRRLPILLVAGCSTLHAAVARPEGLARQGSPPARLIGDVTDFAGVPVAEACVTARAGSRVIAEARTSEEGRFALDVVPGDVELIARAKHLASASLRLTSLPGQRVAGIRLVLGAGLFSESVTVAAALPDARGATASTTVLDRETLDLVPGRALDDVLTTTPGFSLFRRSSSRVANPTAQGASLRGLAASGASRALVLADGVPVNDPFGGWVYWNRVPGAAIDRVEVARGGWSDRYGADAVGGVVQVLTARAGRGTQGRLAVEAGSRGTGRASAFGGRGHGAWNVVAAVEAARSGRTPVVATSARGPIDTDAESRHLSGIGAATWARGPALAASVRVNPFREDRDNGTPAQRNSTRSVHGSVALSGTAGANGWEVRAWGQRGRYGQTFSAIGADRRSETPTTTQRVESDAFGARAQWNRPVGALALVAGLEARQVQADNTERPTLGGPSRTAGGRQRGPGAFARIAAPLGARVSAEGGVRWETWVNRPSGGPDRRASSVSPRASLSWLAAEGIVANASVYRAFRAPTLNELYRGFRVGAIVTLPNEALVPERLTGAEGGLSVTRRRVALRGTAWWSRLDDPVTNVTVASGGRQRQNVGAIRARGFETELVLRPARFVEWTAVVALTASTFRDPSRPALDGRRVPQVPGWQYSSRLRLAGSPLWASAELRRVGRQYEDDRNELPLSPASVIDVVAGWRVSPRFDVRLGVENLMNREVEVGRTPVPTVGLPRAVHVSVRIASPGAR
jgi:outer membrane receptor protein involved in Fe transport